MKWHNSWLIELFCHSLRSRFGSYLSYSLILPWSYSSIPSVWDTRFERGSTQNKDPFLLSLSTDQSCDLSLVSNSLFDLVTLGGWGLLGGSDRREQSTCDCPEVCTGLEASPRSPHSGSSFYFVEEAHGEEGVPLWRRGSFVVTCTSPTATSFPSRKWTTGYIIVSTCFGYFYLLFHHIGYFT